MTLELRAEINVLEKHRIGLLLANLLHRMEATPHMVKTLPTDPPHSLEGTVERLLAEPLDRGAAVPSHNLKRVSVLLKRRVRRVLDEV